MQVEHVIVSSEEITRIENMGFPYSLFDSEHADVPKWAIIALSPAVAILPLLCLLAVVSRIALRTRPPHVRYAWARFTSTLLIVSGVLTSLAATVVFLSLPRKPAVLSTNIPDFDERESYPRLPSWTSLDSAEVSIELNPLVIVVSPISRTGEGRASAPTEFGAGVLLLANEQGYLFATAKHIAGPRDATSQQVVVSTVRGMRASADVVATADNVDLALLWINRRSGHAAFAQPIEKVSEGEPIFVIGHPEGLNYTLSTGVVSGLKGRDLQMTATTSPGNSGGPVYDIHGNLLGIVSAKVDRDRDATAEHSGFATAGDVLQETSGWNFTGDGKLRLQQYIQALDDK